jgi:hypothetical protein
MKDQHYAAHQCLLRFGLSISEGTEIQVGRQPITPLQTSYTDDED